MQESDRWKWGIGSILATSLVLFLLVVILNGGTILVGTVLVIFQIAISAMTIVICLGVVLWIMGTILEGIRNSEARLKESLESLRKSLLRTTNKFGSDFLAFVTGLIAYLIQESVADYPKIYKIAICVLFTLNFFLASQLIGSEKRWDKVLGIFFFVMPVVMFAITVLALLSPEEILNWMQGRSIQEWIMMFLVTLSTTLTFLFGFLKQRDI
jgi:hypothetical protein